MNEIFPALFIGHGSPINIVADNNFTRDLVSFGKKLPRPDAILVVSAHWLTRGTFITSGKTPEQIYDFFGFPDPLYRVRYTAPGSPETADMVIGTAGADIITTDSYRGIDHAAWTILKYLFPAADIPVLELSLDYTKPSSYHFDLGKRLRELRKKNILVIGSGNIIHNLRDIDFNDDAVPFKWASEFDNLIKKEIEGNDFAALINYETLGPNALRAVPYFDHYLPMLYTLGMRSENENVRFIHESIQNGSISMRSFIIE